MMDDFWIRNILLIEYICVFLVNSQNNSMHARFQNMRSDWKYTYWKDGHFLNAEILNSENWLKIHIHSKSTWSFGPLSSFGPVMVIRTPIRKDPRADSQISDSLILYSIDPQILWFDHRVRTCTTAKRDSEMRDKIGLISRLTENTMQNAWLLEYARAPQARPRSLPACENQRSWSVRKPRRWSLDRLPACKSS